jgi:site-specific DNA recombinase
VRVGIYTRLSRDRDGTESATRRQEADCRAWAERERWSVVEVYRDSDLSGSNPDVRRPAYERLVTDIDTGCVDAVLVWKLDRLSRQPRQFEDLLALCQRRGVQIRSMNETGDIASPAGVFGLRLGMALAAQETEQMKLRIRREKAEAAEAGRPNGGGLRPFGVSANGREVVPHEAELIREAARRVVAGESLNAVARDWHERGVVSSRGKPWQPAPLRTMLLGPRLTGKRVHHGRIYDSDVVPQILDPLLHQRVVAILTAPRPGGREVERRLLTGLLVCGTCGHRLTAKAKKDGTPVYRCMKLAGRENCGGILITGARVDELVREAVLAALDTPSLDEHLRAGDDPRVAALDAQVAADEDAMLQLSRDHYVERLIGREEFLAARRPLEERIAANNERLARLRQREILATMAPGERVAEHWERADISWQRSLLRAVVDRVVVRPARRGVGWTPERVEIQWRS